MNGLKNIFIKRYSFKLILLLLGQLVFSQSLQDIIDGDHRSEKNKARDKYRHPIETLEFFGIKNTMAVVEISPGGGWYQEIIAPFLNKNGQYVSATYNPKSDVKRDRDRYKSEKKRLAARKDLYGNAKMVSMMGGIYGDKGSADMILSFRNYHNWVGNSET
jgi:predicted methyltransferase